MLFTLLLILFLPTTLFSQTNEIPNKAEEQSLRSLINLSPEKQKILAILSLKTNNSEPKTSETTILTTSAINNFELLKGKNQEEISLLSHIDRTESIAGYLNLAQKLISPTNNIPQLLKEQQLIKELVENNNLFNTINDMVTTFKEVEPIFSEFWKFKKEKRKLNYFQRCNYKHFITKNLFGFIPKALRDKIIPKSIITLFDKSALMLEAVPYMYMGQNITLAIASMAYLSNIIKIIQQAIEDHTEGKPLNEIIDTAKNKFTGHSNQDDEGILTDFDRIRITAFNVVSPLITLININELIKTSKKLHASILKAHSDFIKIETLLNQTLKNTTLALEKNTYFKHELPEIQILKQIVNRKNKASKDFEQILSLLHTGTFQGNPSVFFSRKGRMLALYTLFKKSKNEFIPLFKTIGKLDALLSLAKLYKECTDKETRYCFVNYLESQKPTIKINNFWNPFLNTDNAIVNSLTETKSEENRCYIFTGPNAGGKSTTMKAIGLSIIMGQTCGIAPATDLSFTPYSYINMHQKATSDNIATAQSSYTAEASEINQILTKIMSLDKQQYAYLTIDELFQTTNSRSGSAIVRAIGRYIAYKLRNCTCIITSHLADIPNIEKDTNGIFQNYKVTIKKQYETDESGKEKFQIVYPHKIEPGIADQSIAIELLERIGFDDDIIENSKWFYEECQCPT